MMPRKAKNAEKAAQKHHKKDRKPSSRHGSATGLKTISDAEDNGSSVAASADYDCVSITGSCSGESEDQTQKNSKEKQETAGSVSMGVVSEKREKIRWKNEKKHERQKERRAKDLKDRSTGYLMSRKLEVLSDQLVCMGFPVDRATMALISTQGHVEKSVAWLLEGADDQLKQGGCCKNNGDLRIDVCEELARMADLEIRCKYPRIEVERAVVACEGDLEKAAEWLRDHLPIVQESDCGKLNAPQEGSVNIQKLDHQSVNNQCKSIAAQVANQPKSGNQSRIQAHATGSSTRNIAIAALEGIKSSPKSIGQVVHTKLQRPTSQAATRPIVSSVSLTTNLRSSYPIKNPVENKQSEPKTHNSFLSPQTSQSSALYFGCIMPDTSSLAPPTLPQLDKPNSVLSSALLTPPYLEEPSGLVLKSLVSTKSALSEDSRSNPVPCMMVKALKDLNKSKNTFLTPETLFPSTNLELSPMYSSKPVQLSPEIFTGWGFGASGGYVDWTMAAMTSCDYRTIDWSMPQSPSTSPGTGLWGIHKGPPTTSNLREGFQYGQDLSKDLSSHLQNSTLCSSLSIDVGNKYDIWGDSKLKGNPQTLGSQEIDSGHSSLEEWTSPFAGKDLFMFPHQAVSFPTL